MSQIKNKYQALFWLSFFASFVAVGFFEYFYPSKSYVLFTGVNFNALNLFTALSSIAPTNAFNKLKKKNPELDTTKIEQSYPRPFKNKLFRVAFAIWICTFIALGPLYLWFYIIEKHQLIAYTGYVFNFLIFVFLFVGLFYMLLVRFRYAKLVDELMDIEGKKLI